MSNDEKVLEHLKMIQGVIERMGRNSFQLKAWSAALATGWLAFVAQGGTGQLRPGFLVLVPFIILFALDGYYLWQERLFRGLYDAVRGAESTDYSMATSDSGGFWSALFSRTVLFYHMAPVILVAVATPGVMYA
ncbi:MAG: hypothetical protein OXP68_03875 [Anaerolineaceae bacterium]|nr:hypothetical protein [Anaerolineaceae bacterium]MDE0327927.1 hypothetical protein [Anaerolineaceae bacterium]